MRRSPFPFPFVYLLPALVACSSSSTSDSCATSAVPQDTHTSARAACTFAAGAVSTDTLPIDEKTRSAIPLRHIVVLMKENRSFDHMLGHLHDAGQPDVEAIPSSFANQDLQGKTVAMTHATTTCYGHDPDHQWAAMHTQVNGGLMDGFVKSAANSTGTDGHFVMTYYDEKDLPFYYWLANEFAVEDRHFAAIRSGTFPNRNVLLLGTNAGVSATGAGYPPPGTPMIFDRLDAAKVTWGVYSDGSLLSGTLGWTLPHPGAHPMADFFTALDAGQLPAVTFVDGIDNVEDEHPTANVQQGEAWTRQVYERVRNSSIWDDTAIILTYDEGGGFADHVPPPNEVCAADKSAAEAQYREDGVRVPLIAISPYARPHHVSHVSEDHSAITRFIETVFGLPALTARDANSTALLDLFDFGCSPRLTAVGKSPEAGTGGCYGSCRLALDSATYAAGAPIRVSFSGCPSDLSTAMIALYPYPATGPTLPHAGPIAWKFTNDSQIPPNAAATSGAVVLDASAVDAGPWPLTKGGYIVYFLLGNSYTAAGSVDLTVQ